MSRIITLLTDFGTADGYVGEMKGVLATGAAGAALVDVAHDVAPHDVDGARLTLARYWRRFPAGTVHVVVIDPGVGGDRAALAVESEGRFLVGPDNGVLSPALLHAGMRCVSLPIPAGAAPTFHGRDVFAPAAAELAQGIALDALGEPFDTPVVRRTPEATRRDDGTVSGVVISIDRFGNAVTNLMARRGGEVVVGDRRLHLARSYSDVDGGALVALVGSSGLVEIARRDGSAAALLGLTRGSVVLLLPA
jgi:S-adenosyl-L-methionine hydrolase (adenosine-forming)